MPPVAHFGATIAIFAGTLALAMLRPGGVNEAWWTCLGAATMVLFGLVTVQDVAAVVYSAKDPLLFLLALLVLAGLLERSGFFDWAAIRAAQFAAGDARALYRNVFVLGAAVTALLSLDTTAVVLTPIVLAFVGRLRLPARPYVFACAFVANTASLPLPISNLTNLVFAGTFHLSFAEFAARMLLPQVVALGVTFVMLRWLFRAQLPRTFPLDHLPDASTVIGHRGYFRASIVALVLVCAGYFVAPLVGMQPYVPAFAVALLLAVCGFVTRRLHAPTVLRQVGWSVFPFVIGLFVVVRGVENLGFARWAVGAMDGLPAHPLLALPVVVTASAVSSNVVNNLPAALLVRSILEELHASPVQVYGALLGTNIGPNVITFGSLATILVLRRARAHGQQIGARDFLRMGIIVTPLVLVATTAALVLSFGGAP